MYTNIFEDTPTLHTVILEGNIPPNFIELPWSQIRKCYTTDISLHEAIGLLHWTSRIVDCQVDVH